MRFFDSLKLPTLAAHPHGDRLAEDRDRRLGLRLGADVEAARAVDALERVLVDAGLEQPLPAALLVAARAEGTDVEGLRLESGLQRRNVELVVVSEDDDGRRVVGRNLGERLLGPLDDDLVGARQALGRRELRPRVGDDRPPAEQLRRSAHRLRGVDRAVDERAAAAGRRSPRTPSRRRARGCGSCARGSAASACASASPGTPSPSASPPSSTSACAPSGSPSMTVKRTARSSRSTASSSRSVTVTPAAPRTRRSRRRKAARPPRPPRRRCRRRGASALPVASTSRAFS